MDMNYLQLNHHHLELKFILNFNPGTLKSITRGPQIILLALSLPDKMHSRLTA